MKTDSELLQEFAGNRSEPAFAELVRRHVDLVYSAALRQVNGDVHLARDVAQRVFIDLARKAKALGSHASLVGWLYTSAHHAAAHAVRSERRRRTHEQEAHAMHEIDRAGNASPDWEQLRPTLDAAMLELPDTDREAVLRRYFSGESFAAIGAALKVSDEAARKRVDRALERLHRLLAGRGLTSSASALALALSHHAVSAAPLGLGADATHAAIGGSAVVATGGILLMNKLAIGLTAAAAAGLMVALTLQFQRHTELSRNLAQQRQDQLALRTDLQRAERELSATVAKATASLASAPPSQFNEEKPITGSERAGLDGSYAQLFQHLRLGRENLAALKDLLVLRQRRAKEAQEATKLRGVPIYDLPPEDAEMLRRYAMRDVDEKIEALLGGKGLAYVQYYERTLPQRRAFTDLESILIAYGEPLSSEQSDQLVAWAAEAGSAVDSSQIPEAVVARAGSILTPLQFEKLKVAQKARAATWRLVEMNQAAAVKGRLRLTSQSAQQYKAWIEKMPSKPETQTAPRP